MVSISEFGNFTATAAKDAVKLYFQPLFTLADMVFGSHSKKPKTSDPLPPLTVTRTERNKSSAHSTRRT